MDRPITVSVAVHPVGEPAGVRDQQGILNDPNLAVATVSPPRAEEVPAAAAVAAVTAPAEPEVLTERKPQEEPEAEDKDKKGKKKE